MWIFSTLCELPVEKHCTLLLQHLLSVINVFFSVTNIFPLVISTSFHFQKQCKQDQSIEESIKSAAQPNNHF